jgi:hypothetical protein
MKKEQLEQAIENVDETISAIAAELADKEAQHKPISTERDMAIIMACCTITKSELPQATGSSTVMDNKLMRGWMGQIAEEAKSVIKSSPVVAAEILGRLSEFAYEFDEDLSNEFDKMRESIESEEEKEARERDDRLEILEAADDDDEEPEDAPSPIDEEDGRVGGGTFSATEQQAREGKQADGQPIHGEVHRIPDGDEMECDHSKINKGDKIRLSPSFGGGIGVVEGPFHHSSWPIKVLHGNTKFKPDAVIRVSTYCLEKVND